MNILPKSCPLFQQRHRGMQLVSFYSILGHWVLVFLCFKGFYLGYIPRYHQWQMKRMIDPGHGDRAAMDWVPASHSELSRDEFLLQVFVTLFLLLSIWAYLMAQNTDPGRISPSDTKGLKASELNERLFDWILFAAKEAG